jgi:cytochrome c biogenesis protein CcmG/thiol:disulfide interchange protein DsbE
MTKKYLLPLAAFGVLLVFLGFGLTLNPREVPSPLIDRPAPSFSLPQLDEPQRVLAPADLQGRVWLLNVWASWCVACRQEHPVLVEFSRTGKVPIYGLNYKDQRADALTWLGRFGNPYRASISDSDGRVGIDYGVYGVPETFVIDKQGVIRYKQVGPITQEILNRKILPLLRQLGA